MTDFIEINHIAPVSRYSFEKGDGIVYQLVFISVSNNKPAISVINLDQIDNISDTIRGYAVRKIIQTDQKIEGSDCIKLFKLKNNILHLLFTGKLLHNHINYNNIQAITLSGAPSVNNKLRHTEYINEATYLDEKFFNFNTQTTDKCVISVLKVNQPQTDIIQRKIINKINKGYLIFNRYSGNIILENIPNHVVKKIDNNNDSIHNQHIDIFKAYYCKRNSKDPTKDFVDDYQIDLNIYKNKDYNNRTKLNYRTKKYEPYTNTIATAPVDSRIRPTANGKGFLCRVTPQDYQYIHVPYSAKLVNILQDQDNKVTTYQFESNYFIPMNMNQRDLPAVIYGNYIHHGVGVGGGTRGHPELLTAQPDTTLTYSLAVIGDHQFTNNKLINKLTVNGDNRWFEQGEELGKFLCRGGNVVCIFNRNVNLTADIRDKTYDAYVRLNDIVCIIN